MKTKLLIIEDDTDLANSIKRSLRDDFSITIESNGTRGLEKLRQDKYHLVLLDLGLPDMSGLEVCQKIRGTSEEIPILILTGTADPEMHIELLEAGADDYVTKPFNARQLQARIDALLRRSGLISRALLRSHDLTIDTRSRKAKRGTVTIALRRKEYDILEYLTRHKGQAKTRAMIFDSVWGDDDWHSSIDVHIKHLRDKIDRPFETKLVETVHGIGYRVKDLPPIHITL